MDGKERSKRSVSFDFDYFILFVCFI